MGACVGLIQCLQFLNQRDLFFMTQRVTEFDGSAASQIRERLSTLFFNVAAFSVSKLIQKSHKSFLQIFLTQVRRHRVDRKSFPAKRFNFKTKFLKNLCIGFK